MLSSDITVAADDCRFSQLEVLRGIMPTGGATIRFIERAGWGDAMKYLLTGMEFNSEQAYRMRLVQEVVNPNMVFSKAKELAENIVSAAPLAVKETIRNSRKAQELGKKEAVDEFDEVQTKLSLSNDAKEGVKSFKEKRKPRFTGN